MKHISFEMSETIHENRFFRTYFDGLRIGVLDIETTGLDPVRTQFVLGGVYDSGDGIFHQIFAQDLGEEREALRAFADLIAPLDAVVTYNGRRFDMPYLKERARRNGLAEMPDPYDLDLYRMVRYHSPLKGLMPNLRQKTLENYMGLWQTRTDEISGAESVDLYLEYTRTEDPEIERQILLHNSDDICQLTRLTKVVEKCDVHKAMYSFGFPVGKMGPVVSEIKIDRDVIRASGIQGPDPVDFRCYSLGGYPVSVAFERDEKTFSMIIPIQEREGLSVIDLRAAGLDEEQFCRYPTSGSGFLVVRDQDKVKYMECNHLVREYIKKVLGEMK